MLRRRAWNALLLLSPIAAALVGYPDNRGNLDLSNRNLHRGSSADWVAGKAYGLLEKIRSHRRGITAGGPTTYTLVCRKLSEKEQQIQCLGSGQFLRDARQ